MSLFTQQLHMGAIKTTQPVQMLDQVHFTKQIQRSTTVSADPGVSLANKIRIQGFERHKFEKRLQQKQLESSLQM